MVAIFRLVFGWNFRKVTLPLTIHPEFPKFSVKWVSHRPIANMATMSPKQGFSVATVAKGWSLVYMLMRVRYLVVFFTLETIKKLSRRSQRRFNVLK